MCGLLPYDISLCHYACIYDFFKIVFIHSFLIKKSCLDQLDRKADHINVSKTFWNKGDVEGDQLRKKLFDVCVCRFRFIFVLGLYFKDFLYRFGLSKGLHMRSVLDCLFTESDRPDVTLYCYRYVKVQLRTYSGNQPVLTFDEAAT